VIRTIVKKILYPVPHDLFTKGEFPKNTLAGTIVFDRKENNKFKVVSLDCSTGLITNLTEDSLNCIYPDICPKTNMLVYAKCRSLERTAYAEIWILKDGSDNFRIAKDGTFPTFSSDGTEVFFERNRKQIVSYNIITKSEQVIFDGGSKEFGSFAVVKPRVSPDRKYAVFTSDKAGRWNLWCLEIDTGKTWHLEKGCEACWFPNNRNIAWIKKYGLLDNVGIYKSSILSDSPIIALQDEGPPFGHEYFPYISADASFLLFSACPISQHDHLTSQYDIFHKDLRTNKVSRLTFDGNVNRWPKYRQNA
jgi:Tol biopolymer transport system component